ncbi:low temperature requirement protein A [Curtobacterium sp. MCBD17_040]|uniref:low temperature requirement protein A n=1 Tax=Curtobacterium sp. MCBD17_040 TaxID=2175674 RepID=UPI0021AD28E9|nr:low temperature requirement protein A [Curtobacterium sp. MCBD17_040]WIB62778.1 low temperature requirement protein A [Curtobacterium sp. MCBD17_040]
MTIPNSPTRRWPAAGLRRMVPRDPAEAHRAASPLELFFDLVFVVAVSFAATDLHHLEVRGHLADAVAGYVLVFFAIWWAWVNFTWFATSFDTDDWLYRVTTFVQMAGVLVLAAGIGPAIEHGDDFVATMGYVVMRLAMVSQWLRAATAHTRYRRTALEYAVGITVVQVLWVLRVTVLADLASTLTFLLLVVAELAVPVVAERTDTTPWHTRHIAERYSLFTLIVLGEGLVASANAVIGALAASERIGPLLALAGAGLVIVAAMWWISFARSQHDRITSLPRALAFGYGHYVVFAAAAAMPAGIEVAIAASEGTARLAPAAAAATISVPVAAFVLAVWALALRPTLGRPTSALVVVLTLAAGFSAFLPQLSLVLTAILLAAIVVTLEVADRNRGRGTSGVRSRGRARAVAPASSRVS